jgi:glycine/D-amino acid oxidase-like deaminating enzyme
MRDGHEAHAVVLGGSIAGLLAARVLTDTHDRVTVVDRDELAPGSTARRGAPQGRTSTRCSPVGNRPWSSCSRA